MKASRFALLTLVTLSGLLACRSLDRSRLALLELGSLKPEDRALSTYERLAGANPNVPFVWLQTIYVDPSKEPLTPEQAQSNARRALSFLPAQPNLVIAESDMTLRAEGPDAAAESLRMGLGQLNDASAEFALRARRADMLLLADRVEEAEQEVLRLSASPVTSAPLVSSLFAGVALGYEFLGDREGANRCLDLSVMRQPTGLERLNEMAARRPELAAAGRALRARCVSRHPWNPDARILATGDQLNQGDVDAALRLLDGLESPLPARLRSPEVVLRARTLSLREDAAGAGALLVERLRQRPSDLLVLEALLLTFQATGAPARELVLDRLAAAVTSREAASWPPPVRQRLEEIAAQLSELPPAAPATPDLAGEPVDTPPSDDETDTEPEG